jgi:protein TonB
MTGLIIIIIIAAIVALVGFEGGWNNVLSGNRNSLVFEDKYKDYGAYQLRKGYGRVLAISLVAVVSLATAVTLAPVLLSDKAEEASEEIAEVNVEMLAPPPTDPNEPPPHPPPPPPPPPPHHPRSSKFNLLRSR